MRLIEVGAGIGSMLVRLLKWSLFEQAEYVLVDEMAENIAFASEWIPVRAAELGLRVEKHSSNHLRLFDSRRDIDVILEQSDVFDFIRGKPRPADLLVAHAFLDLLPMPASLQGLFSLIKPGALAWLTINFDGVTTFEPVLEPALDHEIERLYHQTMDTRPTGGDSQAGRHLFGHLAGMRAQVLAAGPSDWVVFPSNGVYAADEAYFLNFILHFFEESLGDHPGLDPAAIAGWLSDRRGQLERGELVYIAHQLDFLVKPQVV